MPNIVKNAILNQLSIVGLSSYPPIQKCCKDMKSFKGYCSICLKNYGHRGGFGVEIIKQ
jgi:hypothetical protein